MKLAVLAPPEIPLPIFDQYGGIEKLAEDFSITLREMRHEVDTYCTPLGGVTVHHALEGEGLSTPMPSKGDLRPYPSEIGPLKEKYDFTFDWTHQKALALNYTAQNYCATTFDTDRVSYVNDVFPTKAVREAFVMKGIAHEDARVIYPGITNRYHPQAEKKGYLLFLGRIAPYKRPDIAIMLAKWTQMPLKIAGHVGRFSGGAEYADQIDGQLIATARSVGGRGWAMHRNVTFQEKVDLLAGANALVAPSDWSVLPGSPIESFGIVAVEALMSATPIIVSGQGGLGEIVTAETGFICRSPEEYIRAVRDLPTIDPKKCVERGNWFSAERMARQYVEYAQESMTRP